MNTAEEWMNQELMDFKHRLDNRDAIVTAGAKATPDFLPVQVREMRVTSPLSTRIEKSDDPKRVKPFAPILQTPGSCCLYPWPDIDGTAGGPFYPDKDLPAAIDLTGGALGTVHMIKGPPSGDIPSFITDAGNYAYQQTDGDRGIIVWAATPSGASWVGAPLDTSTHPWSISGSFEGGSNCLIGFSVTPFTSGPFFYGLTTDEFSAGYTVNILNAISRQPDDPCIWSGAPWVMRFLNPSINGGITTGGDGISRVTWTLLDGTFTRFKNYYLGLGGTNDNGSVPTGTYTLPDGTSPILVT